MRNWRNTRSYSDRRRGRRGFTLVELIVVLTIIAILAAIGVASVVGYINRSRFDQNTQNAITVYQAAQTAVSHKISNGSLQNWILEIPDADIAADPELTIPVGAETNYSRNKTIALTYNPSSGNSAQGKYLHDFLSSYFYDQAVFGGTISVVFDISVVSNNGVPSYSASVMSVYYSLQNTASTGWDDVCLNTEGGAPNAPLPDTNAEYRYTTSFVGYFNGTEESIRPNISPVFLPWSTSNEMEGHIIGPSTDPEAGGYLFNLRNGETLDVSWAIFDGDGGEHTDHNEYLTIEFYEYAEPEGDEEITPASTPDPIATMTIDFTGSKTSPVVFNEANASYSYEQCDNYGITRLTCDGFAQLSVTINGTSETMWFPMSVTKVIGDGRTGTPRVPGTSDDERRTAPYFEYAISLDCLMERASKSDTENRQYGAYRLFGETPRNIYASISGSCTHYELGENGAASVESSAPIPKTFAARAMNDPAYRTGTAIVSGRLGYGYAVVPNKGMYDGTDDHSNASHVITGTGVVNTLFGDAVYNQTDESGITVYSGGTDWSSDGSGASSAVITSFRHLSNMRWFASGGASGPAMNFLIVNDLDWYAHSTILADGVDTDIYTSQVKVFSASSSSRQFYTPVISREATDSLFTVSFPALARVSENMTLSSYSRAGGKVYSINNVQMRAASFNDQHDTGYGLICENDGLIYNIYTNNLNLILSDIGNGSPNDYGRINQGTVTIENSGDRPRVCRAVGGLVGFNLGSVGKANEDHANNMIVMNNCVIICGQLDSNKWKLGNYDWGVGGVIGANGGALNSNLAYVQAQAANYNSSTYGVMEINGTFAVAAKRYVGGIIGRSYSNIGARLVINDPNTRVGAPEITLPKESTTNATMSCVVASMDYAGGVIGRIDDAEFTYDDASHRFTSGNVTSNPETGVNFNTNNFTATDYGIDINLPVNSLVFEYANSTNDTSTGGAIGYMKNCTGSYLSMRVRNGGRILVTQTDRNLFAGGAIGIDDNCSIANLYIDVSNQTDSLIGYKNNTNGPISAGGAIGVVRGDAVNRTIAIRAENDGLIVARGGAEGQGAGGAIGATDANFSADLFIHVVNGTNSTIFGRTDSDQKNYGGVGGAIGGMHRNTGRISSVSVIYVNNSGLIRNKHYAGGAIGTAPIVDGKVYSVNSGFVRAIDKNGGNGYFAGGAIGYTEGLSSTGDVQSVLNNATISGGDFVGGSVGRVHSFSNSAVVRTTVRGNASVTGSGSLIGGVCGDIRITDTGNLGKVELFGDTTNPTLTVSGGASSTCVGGVAGIMRADLVNSVNVTMPTQEDNNRLILDIQGKNDVGGAIGRLSSIVDKPDVYFYVNDVINNNNASNHDICVSINVVLYPGSQIVGSGNNVGGAIGNLHNKNGSNTSTNYFKGHVSVSTVYSSGASTQIIGVSNVGGAIGRLDNITPYYSDSNSGLYVDFRLSPVTVQGNAATGSDANVGGVIGIIASVNKAFTNNNQFRISATLGTSTITSTGRNVGGAVGKNDNSMTSTYVYVELSSGGSILGERNVGGSIGYNYCNQSNGIISGVEAIINGNVTATGTGVILSSFDDWDDTADNANLGGAIGYNKARITTVTVTINGHVIGAGDAVGGAIGYIDSDNKNYLISAINATLQGSATVEGQDRVGGAVGFNLSNLDTIESWISGNAQISGNNCIGGALGHALAADNKTGDEVLKGNYWGRILRVITHISADYALHGERRMGGAVGQVGYKISNKYCSAALVYVEAEINSAYLFNPGTTETIGNTDNACIGGVVGIFVDGRLGLTGGGVDGNVVLSGTGGVVHLDYPNRTFTNAFCISAYGCSIGGIIGEIGLADFEQNVCVSNISAANGPDICVVSLNDSSRIGGWIGSSYARRGGLGNSTDSSRPVTYQVDNVRAVVSENGSEVGGFCGRIDSYNNNQNEGTTGTWANFNVILDDACVIGRERVGGVFGEAYCCKLMTGSINLTLRNRTNIGDIVGNTVPGDDTPYEAKCYDAGGVIGYVESVSRRISTIQIPITVTIDNTSRVYAGHSNGGVTYTDFGVGGAFGRCWAKFSGNNQSIRVIGLDPYAVAISSRNTNVGGVVGYVVSGCELLNASACVSVMSEGADANVGGVAGWIGANATLNNCHFGLDSYAVDHQLTGNYTVESTGNSSCIGGFAGYMQSATIQNCYTTALVISSGSYTGGFIGRMDGGTIKTSYVGGHTYQGQYLLPATGQYNEGNVVGVDNVGGFVGATVGNNTINIENCYTTASVTGRGSNVGGFVGSRSNNTTIKNSYCTGYVTGAVYDSTGTFAGSSSTSNYNGNNVMNDSCHGITTRYIGSQDLTTVSGITYSDMAGGNKTGHPYDPSLRTSGSVTTGIFPMTTKLNNEHWGDWPLPYTGEIDITNATVVFLDTPDPDNPSYPYEDDEDGVTLENRLQIYISSSEPLIYDTDYTLSYERNDRQGTATVIISAKSGSRYYGVISRTFRITKADIRSATIDLVVYPPYEYTGAPIVPIITVTMPDGTSEGRELVFNRDYYLTYNPEDHTSIQDSIYVTVHGLGNYEGSVQCDQPFSIVGRNINNDDITVTVDILPEDLVYTGEAINPSIIIRDTGYGRDLVLNTDYEVFYETDDEGNFSAIDVGVHKIKIRGIGSYSDERFVEYTITRARNEWEVNPSIDGWIWGSDPVIPTGSTKFGDVTFNIYSDASYAADKLVATYTEGTPAETYIEQMRSVDAGTYYMEAIVAPSDNYTSLDRVTRSFTIQPASLAGAHVVVTPESQYWDGTSRLPDTIEVYFGDGESRIVVDQTYYDVTYSSDTVSVGTVTVTVTGKLNYSGSSTGSYEIVEPPRDVTFHYNDSETEDKVVSVPYETLVSEPDRPTRDHYDFDGWFTDPACTQLYDFDTPVTESFSLYAGWTRLWDVTFETYGGTEIPAQQVRNNGTLNPVDDPERVGYIFRGWYIDSSYLIPFNDWSTPIQGNLTLHAKWERSTHTVTFDSNGGSDVESQPVDHLAYATKPEDPTRDGFTFAGWYNADGTPFDFANTRIEVDISLTAHWDEED